MNRLYRDLIYPSNQETSPAVAGQLMMTYLTMGRWTVAVDAPHRRIDQRRRGRRRRVRPRRDAEQAELHGAFVEVVAGVAVVGRRGVQLVAAVVFAARQASLNVVQERHFLDTNTGPTQTWRPATRSNQVNGSRRLAGALTHISPSIRSTQTVICVQSLARSVTNVRLVHA